MFSVESSLPRSFFKKYEGELTRSRKLRRAFLEERYARLVQAIYSGAHQADLEIAVTYQDGRQGVLKATVHVANVENTSGAARQQPES